MKVSALKTMSLFEYYKGVFSTAMAIFHSPFLSLTSPTFQTTVVLEATRVWIQFLVHQVLWSLCITVTVNGVYFHGCTIIQRGLGHLSAVQIH